ncbi:MAG: permease-like cell division protein FtsX [Clostridia bacterium]|nr:permease-like cell division protein FtsX [Clostridia bacterium]
MAFRELRYFCSEAFKSIFYNILMTLASVITVTGCLLFLGFFTLFSSNLSYIADQIKEECKIVAYIDPALSEAEAKSVGSSILAVPNVSGAEFESKAQAFEGAKKMLGSSRISLDGMEKDGFLRASYAVSCKDLEKSAETAQALRTVGGVQEVKEQQDITDAVLSTTSVIKVALVIAMALLALIAVFIISNTIKLAVFAREKEIHIMKYIGATDSFIRWPFIIEGIFVGLVGGAVSLFSCMAIYGGITSAIANSPFFPFTLRSFGNISGTLTLILLIFGAIMGALGSIIAVRRHLKV